MSNISYAFFALFAPLRDKERKENIVAVMKLKFFLRLLLCVALLLPTLSFAFETDQYNLPPESLGDIGDEVAEFTEENLRKAVERTNTEIFAHQACLEKTSVTSTKTKCDSPDKERAKLDYLRSEAWIARALFNRLGAGFPPFTKSDSWMNSHEFKNQPARYKTSFGDSIFAVKPSNYLTISPTVKIYGAQFGTDKVAHFFQQGYAYYKIYTRALTAGKTAEEAAQKAVRWGRLTEKTYFGTLISGVYSNGDLAANYVGLKFYLNLTGEIKIGNETRPAILLLENGLWTFNKNLDLRNALIKPFLTEHLNEALNPSIYTKLFGLRAFVRRAVRKRACDGWRKQYPNFSAADFDANSRALRLWYGEDYGFKASENFVTISNVCFGQTKTE